MASLQSAPSGITIRMGDSTPAAGEKKEKVKLLTNKQKSNPAIQAISQAHQNKEFRRQK